MPTAGLPHPSGPDSFQVSSKHVQGQEAKEQSQDGFLSSCQTRYQARSPVYNAILLPLVLVYSGEFPLFFSIWPLWTRLHKPALSVLTITLTATIFIVLILHNVLLASRTASIPSRSA